LRQVRMALLEADVALPVVKDFVESVKQRALGQEVMRSLSPGQVFLKIVQSELETVMGSANEGLNLATQPPAIILVAGLQGAGKTTTAAKLAVHMRRGGDRPLLIAADVYRPAAIEQLKQLGAQLDLDVFEEGQTNPHDIVEHGLVEAKRLGSAVVIIDTAGRLHTEQNLMEELKKVRRVMSKVIPDAPHQVWLVLDATTGQNAIRQAQEFTQAAEVTGVILAKMDGTAKGGAIAAIARYRSIPVRFIGTGEGIDDLRVFDARSFVDALFV